MYGAVECDISVHVVDYFPSAAEVTHSVIVNKQDGDPSQAERRRTKKSTGNVTLKTFDRSLQDI